MATCGHGDRRSLVIVPENKILRKQQKMQMAAKRWKMQLRHRTKPDIPNDIVVQPDIPNDIVVEILSLLPAKSLVRFRWTCKYWFDLITRNHDFIKMHLHRSTTHNELFSILSHTTRKINVTLSSPYYNYYIYTSEIFQCYLNYSINTTSYEVAAGHVSTSEVSIALPERPLESCYGMIMGSCNGLILLLLKLHQEEELCIWNSCTREYKILPRPPKPDYPQIWPESYGFGYDQTTDDYKVIRNTDSEVQVYTLGTNSWRRIEPNPPYTYVSATEEVFVNALNGALYNWRILQDTIISFDIGMEKFQLISKLPYVIDHDEFWHNVKLQVFEGSLCMVLKIKEEQNYRAEMWVLMKDYTVNNNNNNNEESLWTKLATIPNLCDVLFPIKPLRYIRNGEILMLNNLKDLFFYDPTNNKTRTLCRISEHPDHVVKEVYSESLVRLNSGTYTSEIEAKKEQTKKKKKDKNKKMITSFVSNQNKIVFREYMRRGVSNQNK